MTIFGYPFWVVLLVCIGVFCASFMDAIGGGGGLISLPAYLLAGVPIHQTIATNKLSSTCGTALATARFIREGLATVDDDDILAVLIRGHVLTDFAHAAQRNHTQRGLSRMRARL